MVGFYVKGKKVDLRATLFSGGLGTALALSAVFFQDGEPRGYATVLFLFLTLTAGGLSLLSAIVLMAVGRLQIGLEVLASGTILLSIYVLMMLAIAAIR